MEYIKKMFDNSSDRESRTTRKEYWMTILYMFLFIWLPFFVIYIGIAIASYVVGGSSFADTIRLGEDEIEVDLFNWVWLLDIGSSLISTAIAIILWRPYHSMLHRRFIDVQGPRWVASVVEYANLASIVIGVVVSAFSVLFIILIGNSSLFGLLGLFVVFAVFSGIVGLVQFIFTIVAFIFTLFETKPAPGVQQPQVNNQQPQV